LFLCFYFSSFFFGVFRHYRYYFGVPQPFHRLPLGVCVPQVGNHWSSKLMILLYQEAGINNKPRSRAGFIEEVNSPFLVNWKFCIAVGAQKTLKVFALLNFFVYKSILGGGGGRWESEIYEICPPIYDYDESRGSAVGIATDYSPGIVKNVHFSISSKPALWPTQPPLQWRRGSFPRDKAVEGREVDHIPPTSAEVKKTWIYTFTPPYAVIS
jgi:hypothetical protein